MPTPGTAAALSQATKKRDRPGPPGGVATMKAVVEDDSKLAERSNRFRDLLRIDTTLEDEDDVRSPSSSTNRRIKGRANNLEKSYLRLQGVPNPWEIRPLRVLKQSLEMVKSKYLVDESSYDYCCDQLKSIRQDLTVQCIRGRFTAHVYETHARIALECGDLPEYNQCQSQLQEMRQMGVVISVDEFDAYRILYSLHVDSKMELAGVFRDIAISRMKNQIWEEDSVTNFAFQVADALRTNNSHKFFRLYKVAPLQTCHLMDFLVSRQRRAALGNLLRSYLTLPLNTAAALLHFKAVKKCEKWLRECGVVIESQPQAPRSDESAEMIGGPGSGGIGGDVAQPTVLVVECKKSILAGVGAVSSSRAQVGYLKNAAPLSSSSTTLIGSDSKHSRKQKHKSSSGKKDRHKERREGYKDSNNKKRRVITK